MKDRIGNRLVIVVNLAYGCRAAADRQDELAKAEYHGAALGHAFRAAELAYDLGQRHGIQRVLVRLPRVIAAHVGPKV